MSWSIMHVSTALKNEAVASPSKSSTNRPSPGSGPMRRTSGSPEQLSQEHERSALVVRLKVFGGLTIPEIAAEVRGAERTVKNDWARVRLAKLLKEY